MQASQRRSQCVSGLLQLPGGRPITVQLLWLSEPQLHSDTLTVTVQGSLYLFCFILFFSFDRLSGPGG